MYKWFKANPDNFNFKEKEIAGDKCVLITPKSSFQDWDENSMIYRSSIWRVDDGFPVSLGYKKFTNIQEKLNFDQPKNKEQFYFREKIDGSCLIVSLYKGEVIIRTRGTFNALTLENGHELKAFKEAITNIFKTRYADEIQTCYFSLIFEWLSPTNQIVIKPEKLEFYFTNIINHTDYSYCRPNELDYYFYNFFGDLKRIFLKVPNYYVSNNSNLEAIIKEISQKKNSEGFVAYFDKGQCLKKIKTDWYLKFHYLKYFGSSESILIDYFYNNNYFNLKEQRNLTDFNNLIINNFDFEIFEYLKNNIENLYNKFNIIKKDYNFIKTYISDNNIVNPKDLLYFTDKNNLINKDLIWHAFRQTELSKQKLQNFLKKM